jgi:hypothetical protein
MPIYRLLQNTTFEPDQIAAMTAAFEEVCRELGLAQREDALRDLVAKAIIDCGHKGDFEPIRLRECAAKY